MSLAIVVFVVVVDFNHDRRILKQDALQIIIHFGTPSTSVATCPFKFLFC